MIVIKKVTVPKFVLMICSLLLVLVGFYCGYKCCEVLTEEKIAKQEKMRKREEKKAAEIQDETDITNQDVIAKLKDSISIIDNIGLNNSKTVYHYQDKILNSTLDKTDKINSLIYKLKNDKLDVATDDIINKYLEVSKIDNKDSLEFYMIDANNFNDLYKKVYGESLSSYDSLSNVYLDKDTNKLLLVADKNVVINNIESYDYRFSEDSNNIYVYRVVGLKKQDGNNCDYYYDIEGNNKYNSIPCDSQTIQPIINKDNYDKFTKYKITFTKNNGNYVFYSSEKLNESKKEVNKNKYIIKTDMKYRTMQNDGGSHTDVYYQIDFSKKVSIKLQSKYVGFEGYEYEAKNVNEKNLSDDEVNRLRLIIDEAWTKKDEKKDIPLDNSYYTIVDENDISAIVLDKNVIDVINKIVE